VLAIDLPNELHNCVGVGYVAIGQNLRNDHSRTIDT